MRIQWIVLALIGFFAMSARGDSILFKDDFEKGLGGHWKKVEFTSETQHTIKREGTNSYVEAVAQSSASGLAVKLESLPPTGTHIRWRWKIDRTPEGGSDSEIKKFDHTARLFVAFKTLIGPPKSINYVWANEVAVGKTFEHPSSGRSRFIVIESGSQKAGQWLSEERDLLADWKRLFDDDSPPAIVGIGFMTDSDGTKTKITGCYDDIVLDRRK